MYLKPGKLYRCLDERVLFKENFDRSELDSVFLWEGDVHQGDIILFLEDGGFRKGIGISTRKLKILHREKIGYLLISRQNITDVLEEYNGE